MCAITAGVTTVATRAVVAQDAVSAILAVGAVSTVLAVQAVSTVLAVLAVLAVHAVLAVDVAILIGNGVDVGGSGSVLVFHGFFSYKLVGVALPR